MTHVRIGTGKEPVNLVVYMLVTHARGYFLIAASSDEDLAFIEPTAAAVAETLRIKG